MVRVSMAVGLCVCMLACLLATLRKSVLTDFHAIIMTLYVYRWQSVHLCYNGKYGNLHPSLCSFVSVPYVPVVWDEEVVDIISSTSEVSIVSVLVVISPPVWPTTYQSTSIFVRTTLPWLCNWTSYIFLIFQILNMRCETLVSRECWFCIRRPSDIY